MDHRRPAASLHALGRRQVPWIRATILNGVEVTAVDGLGWQIRAMLGSLAAGLLMGALYDLCAFLRRVLRLRRVLQLWLIYSTGSSHQPWLSQY